MASKKDGHPRKYNDCDTLAAILFSPGRGDKREGGNSFLAFPSPTPSSVSPVEYLF